MTWAKRLLLLLFLVSATGIFWIYRQVASSLPALDGSVDIAALSAPVTVERDALGSVTLRGENRTDIGCALGFVHAQERFFQMDLQRRRAAGELAALLGAGALPLDRHHRLHRMRDRARKSLLALSPEERALLDAYTDGINRGLAALESPPFEYRLLGRDPEPWRAEDSLLVVASMFFELNDETGRREAVTDLLYDVLPKELADFLTPLGTEWDAPVVGEPFRTPPIPGPGVVGIEDLPATAEASSFSGALDAGLGSNNWVVAGSRTADGRGLLASDMHLRHSVPNIWFRTLLEWGGHRVVGVTLPGTPFTVAGSNTEIAWGFTNTNGDWVDLVEIETDEAGERYRAPEGWQPFELFQEKLEVADGEDEMLEIRETIWGPVVDEDPEGRLRAVKWIAQEPGGINMSLGSLETAGSIDEALASAKRAGLPPQNFVCVDRSGAIGWTIAGRIPARFGFDGKRPSSWADGDRGWNGFLDADDYPEIRNPESGLIWTANARVVSGPMLETIGDGGYAFGARARQIRDDLLALEKPTERDMLEIQLDDHAVFMELWRDLLLDHVDDDMRGLLVDGWTGRASVDSAAYRIVRELRLAIFEEVFGTLTAEVREVDPQFSVWALRQWDGPLYALVSEKPAHLVPRRYASWDAWIDDIVARTVSAWDEPPESRTWGRFNTSRIRHPLSASLPLVSRWLDMPPRPLPGDSNMPRVQSPTHGASERLVVSPGREEAGYFHMPGGQSGHPLSPYYGAGHEDWEEGRPTPLLPGPTEHRLTLTPR